MSTRTHDDGVKVISFLTFGPPMHLGTDHTVPRPTAWTGNAPVPFLSNSGMARNHGRFNLLRSEVGLAAAWIQSVEFGSCVALTFFVDSFGLAQVSFTATIRDVVGLGTRTLQSVSFFSQAINSVL